MTVILVLIYHANKNTKYANSGKQFTSRKEHLQLS